MSERTRLPQIIQGGMGVGVSDWKLARAVASAGQLGVVSGTALAVTLARRLEVGDPEGHLRRAGSDVQASFKKKSTRYFGWKSAIGSHFGIAIALLR